MTTTDIRAEALAGPWLAVLAEQTGWVAATDDPDLWNDPGAPGDAKIVIVRGDALPQDGRLPGSWTSGNEVARWDDFDEVEEVQARWIQAQAMAAGLNAAGKEQP